MITFSYQARDAGGRIVSGIQEALNEDNAVTSLMSRGLMVLSLHRKAGSRQSRRKTTKVKETDLVLFTRQLSTMVEAGISLVQALTALYEQADPSGRALFVQSSAISQPEFRVAKLFTNLWPNIPVFSIVSSSAW